MNDFIRRRVNMLDAVVVWGATFGSRLTLAGQQKLTRIAQNAERIRQLDKQKTGGQTGATGAVAQSNTAFEQLRRLMKGIHDTADAIDHDDERPDIGDDFPLPAGRILQTWLTSAAAFADKAAPHASHFVDYGMPADFLAKLSTLAQRAQQAEAQQDEGEQATSGAVTEMDRLVRRSVREVHSLRAIVRNTFGENSENPDPNALRQWAIASHVEADPQHAKEGQPQ